MSPSPMSIIYISQALKTRLNLTCVTSLPGSSCKNENNDYSTRWRARDWGTLEGAKADALKACNSDASSAGYGDDACGIVDSGKVALPSSCEDSSVWSSTVNDVKSKTDYGKWWSVAWSRSCSNSGWQGNNYSYSSAVTLVDDCNKHMDFFKVPRCTIVAAGQMVCSNNNWGADSRQAAANADYGTWWAVARSKDCGLGAYIWSGSLDSVKQSSIDRCNDGTAGRCGVVDYGKAECTDRSFWDAAATEAYNNCAVGNYWAVAVSVGCSTWDSSWNYALQRAAEDGARNECLKRNPAGKCGIAASGPG